jgi:hypothetical protein
MKKLLLFLSVLFVVSCSSGAEDITETGGGGPVDPPPKIIEKYNIILRKIYRPKFDSSLTGFFGNNVTNKSSLHKSVDTVLIDFSKQAYFSKPSGGAGAYEYVNYIKVVNFSSDPNSGQKIAIDRNFNVEDCIENPNSYKNCEPNGIYYKKGNDIVAYNSSNISEDQLNNLTRLNFQPYNKTKFFKKISSTSHNLLSFTIFKQPFDINFPNGLKVGDETTYSTVIRHTSSSSRILEKLPYVAIKVEAVYK